MYDNHIEQETVGVNVSVVQEATCSEMGTSVYHSNAFDNPAFMQQEKVVDDIEFAPHQWLEPTYSWSNDHTSLTAVRVCGYDSSHMESETVAVTVSITKSATCMETGETTYTSLEFTNPSFVAQSITLNDIPATGHDWMPVVYTWSDDNSTVTATSICSHDNNHIFTETVSADKVVTLSPTESETGRYQYVSAEFSNALFNKQEKAGDNIPALSAMSTYQLPMQLTNIGEEAFSGSACEAVIIPDGCTSIGNKAYADCENLKYVFVPESVEYIAPDAFAGSENVIVDFQNK